MAGINIEDIDVASIGKLADQNTDSLLLFMWNGVLTIYECILIYDDNKTDIEDIRLLEPVNANKEKLFRKNKKSLEFLFNEYYKQKNESLHLIIEQNKAFGILSKDNNITILTKKRKIGVGGILGLINELIH